jgi:hypothetical protein
MPTSLLGPARFVALQTSSLDGSIAISLGASGPSPIRRGSLSGSCSASTRTRAGCCVS